VAPRKNLEAPLENLDAPDFQAEPPHEGLILGFSLVVGFPGSY